MLYDVPVAAQSEEDAVRAVLVTYAERMQARDLDGMEALVAPERGVHIIEGAGVNHGFADYRDHHLGPELERAKQFTVRYFAVEPQVRGDVAWTSFRYELAVEMSGNQMEMEGRGTAVLERREGRWLIVHLHTSGRRKRAEG
jgi:ketosteroid isomerase-like protein